MMISSSIVMNEWYVVNIISYNTSSVFSSMRISSCQLTGLQQSIFKSLLLITVHVCVVCVCVRERDYIRHFAMVTNGDYVHFIIKRALTIIDIQKYSVNA